jgi:hypothetical protein
MTPEQQKMVDSKLYTLQPEGEPPGRSSELLADGLMEIVKLADHCIPFYAYGDNEAACDMSHRLQQITKAAELMRDRLMDESANARAEVPATDNLQRLEK